MSHARSVPSGIELLPALRVIIDRKRVRAARPLLNAVRRLMPPCAEVADLEAQQLLLEGDAKGACAVLDEALARAPGSFALFRTRARARWRAGEPANAARDAAECVVLDPAEPSAKALLGMCLSRLGRHPEARECLAEAVAAVPDDPSYRRHLAAAQAACGDQAGAIATLDDGIRRTPKDVGLRVAAILARMRQADFSGAEALALAASRAGVADASILGLLGHARSSLGQHEAAAEAYAEARKLAPEDPYVAHLAAAAGLAPDTGRATHDYVRVVFDGYATKFDSHLIALGYRIPGLIRAELARLRDSEGVTGPVLDLGCGTGLLAVASADERVGPWIGVDLSPGMLAEAEKRGLYAELHEADVEQFLAREARRFPVVVAGDVMPYFGDLAPLLKMIATRLAADGHILFSVEHLVDDQIDAQGWRLGRLSRYAHTRAHVEAAAAAANLAVASIRDEAVRLETGEPVPGLLVMLRHRTLQPDSA